MVDLDRLYQAVKTKGRIDVVFANVGGGFRQRGWKTGAKRENDFAGCGGE